MGRWWVELYAWPAEAPLSIYLRALVLRDALQQLRKQPACMVKRRRHR
jgi:hypothetical protein